jgi:hypothetical protein
LGYLLSNPKFFLTKSIRACTLSVKQIDLKKREIRGGRMIALLKGLKNICFDIVLYFLIIFTLTTSCEKDFSSLLDNTPDTTSHEFTWEAYEFGTIGSSLNDVFIISPDNIWAVGAIWVDPDTAYNVVHWNGEYWEMRKMMFDLNLAFPGGVGSDSGFGEGKTIYAFGPNEIILFAGTVQYYNGKKWKQFKGDLRIVESWGTSINNLYFCGREGLLLHFDGQNVQSIENSINGNIIDITSVLNPFTNKRRIFCAVYNYSPIEDHGIIEILPDNSIKQFPWMPDVKIESIWFDYKNNFYACGGGAWYFKKNEWIKIPEIPQIYTRKVRANHENDVFIVGDFGLICHYNGSSWCIYPSLLPNSSLLSLDVKGDTVVIVGSDGNHAFIIKGNRN